MRGFELASRVLVLLAAIIAVVQASISALHQLSSLNIPFISASSIYITGKIALGFQVLAIVFLNFAIKPLPILVEASCYKYAVASSRRFMGFWRFLWIMWLVLYLDWFCWWPAFLNEPAGEIAPTSRAMHLSFDLFDILSSAAIFLCYMLMVEKSEVEDTTNWQGIVVKVLIGCFLWIGFGYIVTLPSLHWVRARGYLDGIQGLLSGIAIALFVGRLESKLLDSPRIIVALLYAYAVLQFAYPLLQNGQPDTVGPFIFITSVALIFKVVLFWYTSKIISSRTLTYYMFKYREVMDNVEFERRAIIADLTPNKIERGQ